MCPAAVQITLYYCVANSGSLAGKLFLPLRACALTFYITGFALRSVQTYISKQNMVKITFLRSPPAFFLLYNCLFSPPSPAHHATGLLCFSLASSLGDGDHGSLRLRASESTAAPRLRSSLRLHRRHGHGAAGQLLPCHRSPPSASARQFPRPAGASSFVLRRRRCRRPGYL